MTREEAIDYNKNLKMYMKISDKQNPCKFLEENYIALDMAIEALMDNKPSRTWIAKNEYRRGWHDAITRALSEVLKIHVGNEIFDMVQKETLIGLGLSMDSALGAEPYPETEESYPEPDRPHGEWIKSDNKYKGEWKCSVCEKYASFYNNPYKDKSDFCPNCGADMSVNDRQVTSKLDENTQKHYGFRKKY